MSKTFPPVPHRILPSMWFLLITLLMLYSAQHSLAQASDFDVFAGSTKLLTGINTQPSVFVGVPFDLKVVGKDAAHSPVGDQIQWKIIGGSAFFSTNNGMTASPVNGLSVKLVARNFDPIKIKVISGNAQNPPEYSFEPNKEGIKITATPEPLPTLCSGYSTTITVTATQNDKSIKTYAENKEQIDLPLAVEANSDIVITDTTELRSGGNLTFTPKKVGELKLTIKDKSKRLDNASAKVLNFQVTQGEVIIKAPKSPFTIREGDPPIKIDAEVKGDAKPLAGTIQYKLKSGNGVTVNKDTGEVTATSSAGPSTVEVSTVEGDKPATVEFTTQTLVDTLDLEIPQTVAFAGKTLTGRILLRDKSRRIIEDFSLWEITAKVVEGEGRVSVTGDVIVITPQKSGVLVVEVTATSSDKKFFKKQLFRITSPEVSGFQPVRVALDPMDEGTARYLFGGQVAKDFHVMRVRLFNNLRDETGAFRGDAILAYSESIEVRVTLEKKYNPGLHSKLPAAEVKTLDKNNWVSIDPKEVVTGFYRPLANIENPNSLSLPNYAVWRDATKSSRVEILDSTHTPESMLLALHTRDRDAVRVQATWKNLSADLITVDLPDASLAVKVTAIENQKGIARIQVTLDTTPPTVLFQYIAVYPHKSPIVINPVFSPLQIGSTLALGISQNNVGLNAGDYKWKAEPGNIVSVDENGFVRTLRTGSVVIKAMGKDDNEIASMPLIVVNGDENEPVLPPSVFEENGQPMLVRHRFLYRPYAYDIVLNSFDERQSGSLRNRAFRLADLLTTVVSTLNAANILKEGQAATVTTPTVLDKFSNLLLPGLRRLYPDMRDTQRQNLISMAMRPIEEIPFGSDISRILFIPKQGMKGVMRGYDVRIAEVDTSYFNVTVAIVQKLTSGQGNAVRQ